jgi:PAS domain S-box-containing protein
MMDAQGRTTFANAVTERVTGFKPEELIGHVLHDRIHHTHPDGRPFPIDECPLDRALPVRESVVGYEDVFVHKDGQFYPVRCNARPIFKEGRPVGTVIEVQDISEEKRVEVERKAAEDELKRQKTLLEALTESVLDGILIVSNEGQTLHFNQRFLDIWNFPSEVIKAQPDEVALAWAAGQTTNPPAFLERVAAVYEQPEVKVREEMWLKDGRVYERFGAPIHDATTRLGWVWTFRDITERKRAEVEREGLLSAFSELNATLEQRVEERTEALRQSERRFSQTFNAGPIAACITTLGEGAFLEVNGAFARLTGYRQGEVAGKTYEQLGIWLSPADQTKLELARDAEGNIRNLELKIKTKMGEVKDILLSAGVIDLHGEQGCLTMFYDITRRKEAEAEREVLRQAMDNAEESVVVTTADLELPGPRITYVNAAFTAMTGYQPEEVIGQTPRMFQGPETDRAVLRRMRRRLKVGRTFQGETVNYRKDGSTYILAWNVAPIYGSQGRITHWVSTQHDVTERRALERELLDISAREQRRIAGDLHD